MRFFEMEVTIAITIFLINIVALVIIAVVLALVNVPPLVKVSTARFKYTRYEGEGTLHIVSYAVPTEKTSGTLVHEQDINSVNVTADRFGVKDKVILPANNATNLEGGINYPNTRNFINLRYLDNSTDDLLHTELSLNDIGNAGRGASTLLTKTYKRAFDRELSTSLFVTPSGIYNHRELAGIRVTIRFLTLTTGPYSLRLKVGNNKYVEIAYVDVIGANNSASPIMLFIGQELVLFNNTIPIAEAVVTKKTNSILCNDVSGITLT